MYDGFVAVASLGDIKAAKNLLEAANVYDKERTIYKIEAGKEEASGMQQHLKELSVHPKLQQQNSRFIGLLPVSAEFSAATITQDKKNIFILNESKGDAALTNQTNKRK